MALSPCHGVEVVWALSDSGCNGSVTASSIFYFQVGPSSLAAVKHVHNSLDLKFKVKSLSCVSVCGNLFSFYNLPELQFPRL